MFLVHLTEYQLLDLQLHKLRLKKIKVIKPEIEQTTNNQIKTLSKTPKIFENILFGVERNKSLPKLYLDIKFKNYRTLLQDRDRFIKEGIGYDFNEVKGKISFQGKKINCDVRLKGDLSEHWRSTKRMSFRITLKGDNSILTYKRFSLHKTDARQHPYDQHFKTFKNL